MILFWFYFSELSNLQDYKKNIKSEETGASLDLRQKKKNITFENG